jgi:hypothetical protein
LADHVDPDALPSLAPPRRKSDEGLRRWTDREQLMMYMILAGRKKADIATELGMSQRRVQAIVSSPLFRQRLDVFRQELKTRTMSDFLDRISNEAIPNFEFLVSLRDNPVAHLDDPRVRLGAARAIQTEVDRVYPRLSRHEEERHVRVTFDAQALQQMAAALRDESSSGEPPIDITPIGTDGPLAPKSLDNYLSELERLEAECAEPE